MNVLEKAMIFATKAHEGQTRKLSDVPYILHPAEVGAIIATMTKDRNTMAAGLLHDTVEDCGVDPYTIREEFGPRVAALVAAETEDKLSERPANETWRERKEESLILLENTKDLDVKILWLADKLANMRSFYREYLKDGDEIWTHLNQKDKTQHAWYYKTIAKLVPELSHTAAYQEYVDLTERIFGKDDEI